MTDTDTDTDPDPAPTSSTATARIAAGLAVRPREHHGKRLAEAFRHDAEAERMLKLRESRPEAYAALPASTRTSLAYYSGAREAARALGLDVSATAVTS